MYILACSWKKIGCGHWHFSRYVGNNYELNKAFLAYIELSPFKPIFIALLYCLWNMIIED